MSDQQVEPATIGITLRAKTALGDVVFVELPEVGRSYRQGEIADPSEVDALMDANAYLAFAGEA